MMTPQQHLERFSGRHPGIWEKITILRNARGLVGGPPDWPTWCYAPMAAAYVVIVGRSRVQSVEQVRDMAILSAMAGWRLTKGVYRFDYDIYNALIDTDLRGPIPCEILRRLPEWCVYLEIPHPGLQFLSTRLIGVWAHLEWDANDQHEELRLLLHTVDDQLIPTPIHLGNWTLAEAIERANSMAVSHASQIGVAVHVPNKNEVRSLVSALDPILSLLVYLCAEEPELQSREFPGMLPRLPTPKRVKGVDRLFEAPKIRVWEVGAQTGEALRTARQTDNAAKGASPHGGRAPIAPHVRRAHWHGYWIGPKSGERRFAVRWMSPMVVGVSRR
ncbi:MAG: hypothetical protein HQM00_17375 [Magnetococcales bacterium]|nr:hypothetical protein [Magnetococcales bacterium]